MRQAKKYITHHYQANDPGACCCIMACLRVIAARRIPQARLASEITEFLGALATTDEVLDSLSTAKDRTRAKRKIEEYDADHAGNLRRKSHAMQMEPTDESIQEADSEILISDDNLSLQNKRGQSTQRKSVQIDSPCFITAPDEALVNVIRDASASILARLAQKILVRWESAPFQNSRKTNSNEQDAAPNWLARNVQILKSLFGFSEAESAAASLSLSIGSVMSQTDTVANCVHELFRVDAKRRQSIELLSIALGIPTAEVTPLFDAASPLRSSGLFEQILVKDYDLSEVLALTALGQLFSSESFENEQAVRDHVLTRVAPIDPSCLVLTHLTDVRADMTALLNGAINGGEPGVNMLLYGKPGTGKTEFIRLLVGELNISCYEVGCSAYDGVQSGDRDDRLSYLRMINRLIRPEERAVVLLDEAEDIFDHVDMEFGGGRNGYGRHGYGRGSGSLSSGKAWMNSLLENMRIPTIWITNSASFDAAHLRRFIYVNEFVIPPQSVRRQIICSHANGLPVSDATITALAKNDALTPAMLGVATRFVRLSNTQPDQIDTALLRHTKASLHLLGAKPNGDVVSSETRFDPRYINIDSPISVENLTAAISRTGRAALLFYGPSGAGKTQLANYLAGKMDRTLVYRTGSDLLNMYLGESEQRIAALFRNCDVDKEIIFLDEAEGLLGNREGASRSWEITQVNEFLRQIEQFRGIFIAATNHIRHLDSALMRRFAFRLGFKPLNLAQRAAMLTELSGFMLEVGSREYAAMAKLDQLTAGDFSNVKRRFAMLGALTTETSFADGKQRLTPADWLIELAAEIRDRVPDNCRSIGF